MYLDYWNQISHVKSLKLEPVFHIGNPTVHAHQSFFYKSGIIDRASDNEPKNHQNLWGEPLLPKFDDETQKK